MKRNPDAKAMNIIDAFTLVKKGYPVACEPDELGATRVYYLRKHLFKKNEIRAYDISIGGAKKDTELVSEDVAIWRVHAKFYDFNKENYPNEGIYEQDWT